MKHDDEPSHGGNLSVFTKNGMGGLKLARDAAILLLF
jgi:hypothetical protein